MPKLKQYRKTQIDRLTDLLHKRIGYCGHCGKRDCGGKESNSILPNTISTEILCQCIQEIQP